MPVTTRTSARQFAQAAVRLRRRRADPGQPASAVACSHGCAAPRRCSRAPCRAQAAATSTLPRKLNGEVDWDKVDWNTYDWRDYEGDERGESYELTLGALGWPEVCTHVASFAATSVGKQRCRNLEIGSSLARTLELQRETRTLQVFEQYLSVVLDFGGINTDEAGTALRRAAKGGCLDGPLLLSLAGLCKGAKKLQRTLRSACNTARGTQYADDTIAFAGHVLDQDTHPQLLADVESAIGESGQVRDSASEELKRSRARVATLEGRLRGLLGKYAGEVTTYSGRFCLGVSAGEATTGMVLGVGSGASVTYCEPSAAVPINNELVAARAIAMSEEEGVLWRLTGSIIDKLSSLREVLDAVAWLDVVCARHRYTEWIEGMLPEVVPVAGAADARAPNYRSDDPAAPYWVYLRRLRHPLLQGWYLKQAAAARQAQARSGSRKSSENAAASNAALNPVVPVDMTVPRPVRGVVITGPNTGGKTAALKALGLAVALANAGVGVPAAAPARLPHFSSVLADIGDEQSLTASLSTFSGHLKRIQKARTEADGNCLMLLDEVGTGTDPLEGTALGLAIMERLAAGGAGGAALTVATTHMSALTGLKYEERFNGVFENASAEFDVATLSPTYQLLWGVPGRSNALTIAARLGMPSEILDEARALMCSSQVEVDALVNELEGHRRETERARSAAEAAQKQAEQLRQRLAETRARAEEGLLKAESERAAVVAPQARQLLAALKKMAKQKVEADAARKAAKAASRKKASGRRKAAKQQKAQLEEGWKPAAGDRVMVNKLGGEATVTHVKGNKVEVKFGAMTMTLNVSEVLQI